MNKYQITIMVLLFSVWFTIAALIVQNNDLIDAHNHMTSAMLELRADIQAKTLAVQEAMDLMTCGEWEDHE